MKDQQDQQHDDLLDRAVDALRSESASAGPPSDVLARLRHTMTVASELQAFSQGSVERTAAGKAQPPNGDSGEPGGRAVKNDLVEPISIIVGPSASTPRSSLFGYFSQMGPFSYLVSALVMCVAVLGAWLYKMADRIEQLEIVQNRRPVVSAPRDIEQGPVGHVSGMDECCWAADASQDLTEERLATEADLAMSSPVSSGRTIHLKSGLLEISYKNGAQVILQGPANFRVEAGGGFLLLGELTGRLDVRSRKLNSQLGDVSSIPFAIQTPTAVVTDLGTEFNVRVDAHGNTTSRVFRGAVRIHPTAVADDRQDCVLREDEAVQVVGRVDRGMLVRHIQGDSADASIPVLAYGTGTQRRSLDGDPHWQVVAVSGQPDFRPAAADRVGVPQSWQPEGAGRTHWISTFAVSPDELSAGATLTFRTTIRLHGATPESTVLCGWFLTNGRVNAIRLNGQPAAVPEHGEHACRIFSKFVLNRAFVDGDNTLELDVVKGERHGGAGDYSPFVSLCVDFVGGLRIH